MFEVSWQDPAVETVAQRRERKDREEGRPNRKARRPSVKSVDSIDSSPNQAIQRPSVLELFTLQRNGPFPSSGGARAKTVEPTLAQKRLASSESNSAADLLGSLTISTGGKPSEFAGSHRLDGGEDKLGSSSDSNSDSIFSGRPRRSSTDLTWDSMTDKTSKTFEIQPLTPNSFVSRCIEVTISNQDDGAILDHPVNEVHITAGATLREDLDLYSFPVISVQVGVEKPPMRAPKSTRGVSTISQGSKAPDLWKPPSDWDCSPEDSDQECKLPKFETQGGATTQAADFTMTATLADIRRMATASPEIMLQRLREEWSIVANVEIRKQAEQEKTLWMLVALRAMVDSSTRGDQEGGDLLPKPLIGPRKVLSLYESKASTCVLASFMDAQVHHIATATTALHGIRPITVPSPSVHLPYALSIFSSIFAMSLPAALSSSSIPALLRECHRVLTPTGTLCLTIMDPSPAAATLGPKLRAWLEDHLLLSLEKQFRCTSPGRLLPIWMRDAGFAIPNLTGNCTVDEAATKVTQITRISFFAGGDGTLGEGAGDGDDLTDDAVELKTLVGRMLWKEIWGQFSDAEKWWWEDATILDECRSYGTQWDCSIIKAAKLRRG